MFMRRVPDGGPLKAAVIGAGAFGRHHCTKLRAAPGVELSAIADTSADIRRKAAAEFGVKVVADWRELLGRVDIVSVSSPAVTHAAISRAFLAAGAHVLVEKPIATTMAEADDLVALARRTGRILTVGHQERFVFAGAGLLDQPVRPFEIECWRRGPWTGRGDDVSAVLDLMIHDLDLVHTMVDSPVAEVRALGMVEYGPSMDEIAAEVRFADGTLARLDTSRVAPARKRGFKARYADGVVEIDFLNRTVVNTTPRPLQPLEASDPLGDSIAAFVAAVRGAGIPMVLPEQAALALKTALLIEEAAEAAIPASARSVYGRIAAVG